MHRSIFQTTSIPLGNPLSMYSQCWNSILAFSVISPTINAYTLSPLLYSPFPLPISPHQYSPPFPLVRSSPHHLARPLARPPAMEPSLLLELSIQTLKLLSKSLLFLSDLSTHPLFSVAATSSVLALLYLPRPLLPFLLSPAFLSSLLLVSTLLSLRPPPSPPPAVSPPRPIPHSLAVDDPIPLPPGPDLKSESAPDFAAFCQKVAFCDSFVEWSRRGGPLEVIYEEYEGEEDEDGGDSPEYSRSPEYSYPGSGGLGSLGFCFTDSSDDDSDDNSSVAED